MTAECQQSSKILSLWIKCSEHNALLKVYQAHMLEINNQQERHVIVIHKKDVMRWSEQDLGQLACL